MIGTTENIPIDTGIPETTFSIQMPPQPQWVVTIPRGGHFQYNTQDKLTIWQRFWMRFIGWGVKPYE